jgi:hypothetical protein
MSEWVDLQLSHHLAPAKAPDELWARVSRGTPSRRPASSLRWLVPAAAVAACVAALLAAPRPLHLQGSDVQRLASAELSARRVDFTSSDPAALSAWLHREAGVDAPLRNQEGVRLIGARVVRHGVGAISCQVDGRDATVLIALGHERSSCKMPGHTVAVASVSGPSEALCRMCHSL